MSDRVQEIVDLYKTRETLMLWSLMDLMRHGEVRPSLGDEIGRVSREIKELIKMLSFQEWKGLPEEIQREYEFFFVQVHRRCPRCGSKIMIEHRRTPAGRNYIRDETTCRCSLCSFEKTEERVVYVGEEGYAMCD
jgi:DNA-directed RNA polymerase subunit RPC12/RpoP